MVYYGILSAYLLVCAGKYKALVTILGDLLYQCYIHFQTAQIYLDALERLMRCNVLTNKKSSLIVHTKLIQSVIINKFFFLKEKKCHYCVVWYISSKQKIEVCIAKSRGAISSSYVGKLMRNGIGCFVCPKEVVPFGNQIVEA